jgi:hypothetical protein
MAQTELGGYQSTVDPRTEVLEVWRCQASQNVEDRDMLCAIDDIAAQSTEQAIRNSSPLADFGEYGEVKEYKATL